MEYSLKGKAYCDALAAYNRHTNERLGMKQRLRKLLSPLFANHVVQQDGINVLGVGCGDGDIDLEILEIIKGEQFKHSSKTKIFERAIDPNINQLDQFQSSEKHRALIYNGGVRIAFSCMTFDEYVNNCAEKNCFDIVHFVLSIFWTSNIEECLVYTMEHLLKKNGTILVVMSGNDVVSFFSDQQRRCHIGARAFPFHEVIKIVQCTASKYGWKCDMVVDEYAVDIAKVFDEHSPEGNLILNSCTGIEEFRNSVDRRVVDKVIELMREYVVLEVDGKCLCKRMFYYFLISKD